MSKTPDNQEPPNGGSDQRLVRLGEAIHRAKICKVEFGRIVHKTERRRIRVIAVAEGYAMVRRKGAMPYVCPIKEISQPNSKP